MIFNESNVKVIREYGYLSKYVGKKAPYFPFTSNDLKNNVIILIDSSYTSSRTFIQIAVDDNKAIFYSFYNDKYSELIFNFGTMEITRIIKPLNSGVV